jgi:hypothetical protein
VTGQGGIAAGLHVHLGFLELGVNWVVGKAGAEQVGFVPRPVVGIIPGSVYTQQSPAGFHVLTQSLLLLIVEHATRGIVKDDGLELMKLRGIENAPSSVW